MEVHAHTHTPRKKWTHYFWEFFMLFLAVTSGFFVENQREHMVEHRREKEFMVSLVKDLESDTAQFSRIRLYRLDRLRNIDSIIIFFLDHPDVSVPASGYILAAKLFGHVSFFQNSGTLDQLKTSEGLRLIRQRNVVDSIQSYDQQIKRMALRDIYETNFMVDQTKVLQKLFDGRELLRLHADTTYDRKPPTPFTPVKIEEQYVNEYLNGLKTFQFLVKLDMDLQATIKTKAVRLINLINKEYHLE
ncbi:MAG: hypothetical protein EPN92_10955 [Chitinophagaceae bacterium]|nr:MAG: hypothetical protein EPN92_10955 [Chitinophagaceae bacterium]